MKESREKNADYLKKLKERMAQKQRGSKQSWSQSRVKKQAKSATDKSNEKAKKMEAWRKKIADMKNKSKKMKVDADQMKSLMSKMHEQDTSKIHEMME